MNCYISVIFLFDFEAEVRYFFQQSTKDEIVSERDLSHNGESDIY